MNQDLHVGLLVAYVGPEDPDNDLFTGQPGVVIDLGPVPSTHPEPSVSFASGPSVGLRAEDLASIDDETFQLRADRMKSGLHPLADRRIAPFDITDPRGPAF